MSIFSSDLLSNAELPCEGEITPSSEISGVVSALAVETEEAPFPWELSCSLEEAAFLESSVSEGEASEPLE